jgi:biotin carboxyl carrier protein
VVAKGGSRRENLARLAEMLRCTELRGDDLQTNMPVLYGLLNWMLGKDAMVKPTTAFMKDYLAAVGAVEIVAREVDLELAWAQLLKRYADQPEAAAVLRRKATLLVRPLQRLLCNPHLLAGFLGLHDGRLWRREGQSLSFGVNPVEFLAELYRYINLEDSSAKPPSEKIWDHDHEILADGLAFYDAMRARTQTSDFEKLSGLLRADDHARIGDSPQVWQRCQAAHRGHQLGMELLLIIPRLGQSSGFFECTVDDTLTPSFPERFRDSKSSTELIKALAPPPASSSDEIVTPTGGHFYSREAPHLPPLVEEGQHFEAGQPLFIIEVMKMFNKVLAPFAGTVKKKLLDADGKTVLKGQPIFKIEPDEVLVFESEEQKQARRRAVTLSLLG